MKKMLGLLMALMVVSSATTLAAERHHAFQGDSGQRQEYCCGGYDGNGGYGYCGGWRGRDGSNQ